MPRGKDPVLTAKEIDDLKAKGYSQSDIARMYGITRAVVSYIKRTYGGKLTPREEALESFPWHVPTEMGNASPYRRLRDHAEFMVTGGKGMSKDKLHRLKGFYDKLRRFDVVVEFDPDFEPEPGVSNSGGWKYVHREKSDQNLIIRKNKYVKEMPATSWLLWNFPPSDPDIGD